LDINVTLVVQILVFMVFVWFTMKFVWPPLSKALEERQAKIADGLASAERGRKELELAQHRVREDLRQTKIQSADIIEKANRRAAQILEESKEDTRKQVKVMTKAAEEHLTQAVTQARQSLQKEMAALVVSGAEKIIKRAIDDKIDHALVDKLIEEI
jgi:F-type H+-transporting ATPase subunit b